MLDGELYILPDMRFAPPKQLRIADRSDGLNPERVRSYNERLVLSLLLQNEGISRLEIGSRTKLSQQTVSVIVRSLEQEGLLARGQALRGRVGPPTIPVLLNPDGAFSVGIDLGSLHTEVVLIDFMGGVRFHTKVAPHRPGELDTSSIIHDAVNQALLTLPADVRARVTGIGLAMPDDGNTLSGARETPSQERLLQQELEQKFKLPVFVQNDITAAVGAEMMFGATRTSSDYLFFYIDALLHCRLVLNNHVYTGNQSVAAGSSDAGLLSLKREILRNDSMPFDPLTSDWTQLGDALDRWRSECIGALKKSTRALSQFVDLQLIVISASVPSEVTESICKDLQHALTGIKIKSGELRTAPKAVGAGSLPFISRFTVQH